MAFITLYNSVNCDYAKGCLERNPPHEFILLSKNDTDFIHEKCYGGDASKVYKSCSNEKLPKTCDKSICWETYVGQELYQLTLIDFLVQVRILVINKIGSYS